MQPKLPDYIVDKIKQVNLVNLVGADKLTRKYQNEYQGPCPKCQGTDRFTVRPDGWFCRQCKPIDPKHGWHDAIDYMVWLHGLTLPAAVEQLTGEKLPKDTNGTQTTQAAPTKPRPENWQAEAVALVDKAHDCLMNTDNLGGDYLAERGLFSDVWIAYHVGFTMHYNTDCKTEMPAIVLPWYGKEGLMAVRFRWLQPAGKHKIISLSGSQFAGILFGRNALLGAAEKLRTLIVCEGEINAMSIWQAHHEAALDVLSLGSESAKLTPAMVEYAKRFMRVIVWMDKPEVVRELMGIIPGAYGISSPQSKDANDLLRQGLLGGFLATVRRKAAQTDYERDKLRFDLSDMMRLPGRCDCASAKAT